MNEQLIERIFDYIYDTAEQYPNVYGWTELAECAEKEDLEYWLAGEQDWSKIVSKLKSIAGNISAIHAKRNPIWYTQSVTRIG